jgi:hypothetical protein
MALVGSIVVGMIAQTDKFLAPFAKVQKALAGFGANVGSFLAGPVGRIEAVLGQAGKAIGDTFAGIDKTGDAADRIGTTTAALTQLRYAAKLTGSETESLDAALLKFSANLGDAVANSMTPAAVALKEMKLDPKQLASVDITEAFAQVSDALKEVGSDAQRNAKLMDLFGKGGVQIANTMKAGGAEIRRLSAEVQGYGGVVSETARQQVAVLMDSIDRAGAALAGLGTQVAVGISPYIDAAITSLSTMASDGVTTAEKVSEAMGVVVRRIGDIADFAQGTRNVFLTMELVASKVFVAIMDGAATLARGLDQLLKATTGYTTGVGQALSNMAVEFKKTSTEFQDSIWKTMGDDAWGDKFRKAADTAIAKSREMAAEAAKANKKTTQSVKASTKEMDDVMKKAAEKGKAITKDVETPMEQFRDKLADIREALSKGQITRATAIRATNKASEELKGKEPVKFAGALEAGTAEARSAILAAITGRGSKEDAIAKNTGDAAAILGRIEKLQNEANKSITKEEMAMY